MRKKYGLSQYNPVKAYNGYTAQVLLGHSASVAVFHWRRRPLMRYLVGNVFAVCEDRACVPQITSIEKGASGTAMSIGLRFFQTNQTQKEENYEKGILV